MYFDETQTSNNASLNLVQQHMYLDKTQTSNNASLNLVQQLEPYLI